MSRQAKYNLNCSENRNNPTLQSKGSKSSRLIKGRETNCEGLLPRGCWEVFVVVHMGVAVAELGRKRSIISQLGIIPDLQGTFNKGYVILLVEQVIFLVKREFNLEGEVWILNGTPIVRLYEGLGSGNGALTRERDKRKHRNSRSQKTQTIWVTSISLETGHTGGGGGNKTGAE